MLHMLVQHIEIQLNTLDLSLCLKRLDLSHENETNKKSMQSYLISHVLFDGKEDVHVTNKNGSQRHLVSML
jgi:hypothetical protein